jgi:TonB family protein
LEESASFQNESPLPQANRSQKNLNPGQSSAYLSACLVDANPGQLATNRRRRSRSVLVSTFLQLAALAAVILVPLLSKTERIALANVTPLPPYHHVAAAGLKPHAHPTIPPPRRGLSFCLSCPPRLAPITPAGSETSISDSTAFVGIGQPTPTCHDCEGLANNRAMPAIPRDPTPRIIRVTSIDPALLIHRVEPVYPILAHQTGRAGRVELHAIIATDGSIHSLQVVSGDPLFFSSALDAVRQWRYKPTTLNNSPVEVDTHITVIYNLSHN